MIIEVVTVLNFIILVYLAVFLIRSLTESNLTWWEHGMRLDDLEHRVDVLEKRVEMLEEKD